MKGIHILAIIVGALVPMFVGFIWYSKALFGNAWMQSIGKTEEDIQQGNMALTFGVSFIMALVLSFFMFGFLGFHDVLMPLLFPDEPFTHGFKHGLYHGGLFGVMIALPVLVTNSLFEQKNWTNIGINAVYWVVTMALMGGVISLFL